MKLVKVMLIAATVFSLSACGFDFSSECQLICF